MSLGMWIIVIVGGAAGLLSTLYLLVSLFVVLGYKLYRKVIHKTSWFA